MYTNALTLNESAAEDLFYTPTAGQPGFVAGFGVTYHIVSGGAPVAAPESGTTIMLLALAFAGVLLLRRQLCVRGIRTR